MFLFFKAIVGKAPRYMQGSSPSGLKQGGQSLTLDGMARYGTIGTDSGQNFTRKAELRDN